MNHEELLRLATAAETSDWWAVDHLAFSNPVFDKADSAYIAAASPDVVLALLDEIARKDALLRECKTAIDGTAKSIVANRGLAPAMFYILLEAIEKELT